MREGSKKNLGRIFGNVNEGDKNVEIGIHRIRMLDGTTHIFL